MNSKGAYCRCLVLISDTSYLIHYPSYIHYTTRLYEKLCPSWGRMFLKLIIHLHTYFLLRRSSLSLNTKALLLHVHLFYTCYCLHNALLRGPVLSPFDVNQETSEIMHTCASPRIQFSPLWSPIQFRCPLWWNFNTFNKRPFLTTHYRRIRYLRISRPLRPPARP